MGLECRERYGNGYKSIPENGCTEKLIVAMENLMNRMQSKQEFAGWQRPKRMAHQFRSHHWIIII